MIDFRYHLVSLISVFIALAVGIVLGAGPLRDTISDQLTGQVEVLREEKDALRVEVDDARATIADQIAFLEQAGPGLLDNQLPDYRVAVLTLPGAPAAVTDALVERVEEAGADVTARGELTTLWADPDQSAFRSQVADQVRRDLTTTDLPEEDAGVLGTGLGVALTEASAEDPRLASTQAADLLETLTGGTEPLLTLAGDTAPADLVLVVTAPTAEPAPDATPDPDDAPRATAWADSFAALAGTADSVVAGYADRDADLLVAVRGTRAVSTVDGIGNLVGQLTAPLALAAVADGEEVRPYGFGIGAAAVLPPRADLTGPAALEPTPTPTDDGTPGSGDGAGEDGTGVTGDDLTGGEDASGDAAPGDTTGDATAGDGQTP